MAHLRSLDGLRGVAVLAVVVFHFAPSVAPGGFLGVDVFFVLSGFLITSLLVKEWEARERVALGAFWARRARRLLPALLLLLVVVLLYELATEPGFIVHRVATDGLSALTYVANWHFITTDQPYVQQIAAQAPGPLHHVWSLAIEEQFYLVWPLVVVGLSAVVKARSRRLGRRRRVLRRTLVGTLLVLASVSLLWMVNLYEPGEDPSRVYFGTDTHGFPLMIGAVLGAMSAGEPVVAGRGRAVLAALGAVLAAALVGAMATVGTDSDWLYQGGYGLVALSMALVLAGAVQPGRNLLRSLLETRAFVGLGIISYGVYLWHWPAFIWITEANSGLRGPALFVVRSAVTVGVALASYFVVERPIRAGWLPRWGMRPGLVPAAAVTCVALLMLVPTVAFPSVAELPAAGTVDFDATAAARYRDAPRCDETAPDPAPLNVDGHRVRVQLVGNSFALEMAECLRTILRKRGARLDVIVGAGDTICLLADRIRARTRSHPPDAAVLFQYTAPTGGSCTEWQTEVDEAVEAWTDAGVHVLLMPSVPIPGETFFGDGSLEAYTVAAQRDPEHVTVVDSGAFLRDDEGRSQWMMPCVARDEPGCTSAGSIAVRWPGDRGLHFCADPVWPEREDFSCPPAFAGGRRRVVAALALELFTLLEVDPATYGTGAATDDAQARSSG